MLLSAIGLALLFYSVGGLLVTVAAGTSLLENASVWWRWATAFALLGAVVDTAGRLFFRWDYCGWDDPLSVALIFGLFALGTIILAIAARLLVLFRTPVFFRVVICLAIDLALRFGTGIVLIFLLFMRHPECMK